MAPAVDQRPETRPILVLHSRETFSDDLGGFGEAVPGRHGSLEDASAMEAFAVRRLLVGLRQVDSPAFPILLYRGEAAHGEPELVATFGHNGAIGIAIAPLRSSGEDPAAAIRQSVEAAGRRRFTGVAVTWLCLVEVDAGTASDDDLASGVLEAVRSGAPFQRVWLVGPSRLVLADVGAERVRSVDLSTDYAIDFVAWARAQAALALETGGAELDLPNLAEELRSLGNSEERARNSHIRNLVMHLLKWQFQPDQRSRSWLSTIERCRADLDDIFRQSPSLDPLNSHREDWPALATTLYERARRLAVAETGLPATAFPETCPYTIDQILDPDFLPGPVRDEDLQP
jgi:hypothetical protein